MRRVPVQVVDEDLIRQGVHHDPLGACTRSELTMSLVHHASWPLRATTLLASAGEDPLQGNTVDAACRQEERGSDWRCHKDSSISLPPLCRPYIHDTWRRPPAVICWPDRQGGLGVALDRDRRL